MFHFSLHESTVCPLSFTQMFRGNLPLPPVSLQLTATPQQINTSCSWPTMWVLPAGSLLQQDFKPWPSAKSCELVRLVSRATHRERDLCLGEREWEFKRCNSLTWEQQAALPVCPLYCCAYVCSRGAMGPLLHPAPRSPTTRPNCPTATRTRTIVPNEAGSGINSLFWKSTSGRKTSMWGR